MNYSTKVLAEALTSAHDGVEGLLRSSYIHMKDDDPEVAQLATSIYADLTTVIERSDRLLMHLLAKDVKVEIRYHSPEADA